MQCVWNLALYCIHPRPADRNCNGASNQPVIKTFLRWNKVDVRVAAGKKLCYIHKMGRLKPISLSPYAKKVCWIDMAAELSSQPIVFEIWGEILVVYILCSFARFMDHYLQNEKKVNALKCPLEKFIKAAVKYFLGVVLKNGMEKYQNKCVLFFYSQLL